MTIQCAIPLSEATTIRIGGKARYLIDVRHQEDLWEALDLLDRFRLPRLLIIGRGSNLLLPDSYFDGVVVRVAASDEPVARQLGNGVVQAFGGVSLDALARWSLDQGLTGLEWAGGLPGTIGAAVRGNAGAFGHEIEQRVMEVEVVSVCMPRGQVAVLDRQELAFSYRESRVKREPQWIVRSVTLQLRGSGPEELAAARSRYAQNIDYRRARHPLEYPNCGSVFKNLGDPGTIAHLLDRWPDIEENVQADWHGKVPMGYVIGRLGMAGLRSGNVEISMKHHNFIVNRGGATARDVQSLIARVRTTVEETFGFKPEVEIQIIE